MEMKELFKKLSKYCAHNELCGCDFDEKSEVIIHPAFSITQEIDEYLISFDDKIQTSTLIDLSFDLLMFLRFELELEVTVMECYHTECDLDGNYNGVVFECEYEKEFKKITED